MIDGRFQRTRQTFAEVPEIAIFSSSDAISKQPVTIFAIELFAGDLNEAAMAIKNGNGDPLISVRASAGGVARFVPAAPAYVREPLRVEISGVDAVGTVAFR